ncbi:hypothetical protein ACFLT2_01125 [Acidobacteriota bacterium]
MSLFKELGSKDVLVRNRLTMALYWGSLWGLSEATLGHILHIVRIPGLAGFVMFPVGIFFMLKAYRDSNSLRAIFTTAVVAAAIKLSDLLLPGTYTIDVFRPAMAIMTESLAIVVLISFVESRVFQQHLIQK